MLAVLGNPVDSAVALAMSAVSALTSLLTPAAGDLAAAAAVVVLTLAVRLLLLPLSILRLRAARRQTDLARRVQAIRRDHRDRPGRMQRELAEPLRQQRRLLLHQLLPALAQLPFAALLYRLCVTATVAGHANGLLTHAVFGTALGHQWLYGVAAGGLFGPPSLVFAGLFVLLAVVGWWSARLGRRAAAAAPASSPTGVPGLTRVTGLLAYAPVLVAAVVPLAAGISLLVTTAVAAAERHVFEAVSRRPLPT